MNSKAMCESTAEAEANRDRVAKDYCGSWWREQERIAQGWEQDTIAPKGLALGELPIVLNRN